MPATYKILIMGASYGSLLASKMLFGGHKVHLVCLPAEADLINAEGFRVRMPVQGPQGSGVLDSRKLPGKVTAGGAAGVNPKDYDLVGLAMQEPQYRSPGVRELLDAVAKSKVPCMSIMNMPPLPYVKRIPGLELRCAQARLYRSDACGTISIRPSDVVQPRPAGDPSARGKGQRAASDAADQFQGREVRQRQAHRASCGSLKRTSTPSASITPEGKIELPVKLRGARFDFRAARQMVDAARRQLSLHHQGRHAHRAGSGALEHRRIAFGLQFRLRSLRQARRQRRTIWCRSRNTPPRRRA